MTNPKLHKDITCRREHASVPQHLSTQHFPTKTMTRMTPREKGFKVMLRLVAEGYRTRVSSEFLHLTLIRELDLIQSWRRSEMLKAMHAWGYIEPTGDGRVWLLNPFEAGVDATAIDKAVAEKKEAEAQDEGSVPPGEEA